MGIRSILDEFTYLWGVFGRGPRRSPPTPQDNRQVVLLSFSSLPVGTGMDGRGELSPPGVRGVEERRRQQRPMTRPCSSESRGASLRSLLTFGLG